LTLWYKAATLWLSLPPKSPSASMILRQNEANNAVRRDALNSSRNRSSSSSSSSATQKESELLRSGVWMKAVELCGYGVEHTPLDTAVYLILHKTANMKVPMTYSQNSHAKDTIFRSSQKVLNSELFFCSECVFATHRT
jgi:hypothetical protein